MSTANGNGHGSPQLLLDPPPPDVKQAVVAVPETEAMSAPPELRLSEPEPDVKQAVVAVPADGAPPAGETTRAMGAADESYDDVLTTDPLPDPPAPDEPVELGIGDLFDVVTDVAAGHSATATYTAIRRDERHGLCAGLLLASQRSGRLGALLRLMRQRNAAKFAEVFGPAAEELVATTTAGTADERLRPVGGEPLTSDGWASRFTTAAGVAEFQAAQNEEAIEGRLRPAARIAIELGLDTDRALAMTLENVVTYGLGTGLRRVAAAATPFRTPEQVAHALAVLGHADVAAFQTSTGWVPADGRLGPQTHAALAGALRRHGAVPLPDAHDLCDRLVRSATGPALDRLRALRDAETFTDTRYRLPAE